jgi:hypothetical protein
MNIMIKNIKKLLMVVICLLAFGLNFGFDYAINGIHNGPKLNDGILLETGGFLLLESNSYLLLE